MEEIREEETRGTSQVEALNNITSRLENSRVPIANATGRELKLHLEELVKDYAKRTDKSQSPEDFLNAKGGYNLEGFRLLPTRGWGRAVVGEHFSEYSQEDIQALVWSEKKRLTPWYYDPPRIERISDPQFIETALAVFEEGYLNLEHPNEESAGCRLQVKVAKEDINYKGGRMPKGGVRGMALAIPRSTEVAYLKSTAF